MLFLYLVLYGRTSSGEMVGAVGVSGGSVSQDKEVARAAARAVADTFYSYLTKPTATK